MTSGLPYLPSLRQRIVPEQKELLGGLGAGGPIGAPRDGKAP